MIIMPVVVDNNVALRTYSGRTLFSVLLVKINKQDESINRCTWLLLILGGSVGDSVSFGGTLYPHCIIGHAGT